MAGRLVLQTACWVAVAGLLLRCNCNNSASAAQDKVCHHMTLTICATIVVTAISLAVQATAQAFPVAFLTTTQATDRVHQVLGVITAATPLLQRWVYPLYQEDAVYLGIPTPTTVDTIKTQDSQDDDVESPRKSLRMESYPELSESTDPLVFEEHAF